MRTWGAGAAATVLAALGALPSVAASASTEPEPAQVPEAPFYAPENGSHVEFSLPGGDQNTLSVFGQGNRVSVRLSHGLGVDQSTAEYLTVGQGRATATATSLHADFGDLGTISVRFQPTGRPQKRPPPENCSGGPERYTGGLFRGTIRFHSEDRALSFNSRRARGYVIVVPPEVDCDEVDGGAHALADRRGQFTYPPCLGPNLSVSAPPANTQGVDEYGTSIVASSLDRDGPIAIIRTVFVLDPKSPLSFTADLSSATLKPPAPFSGTGKFSLDPATGQGTLSGTLKVAFIGREMAFFELSSMSAKLKRVRQQPGTVSLTAARCANT